MTEEYDFYTRIRILLAKMIRHLEEDVPEYGDFLSITEFIDFSDCTKEEVERAYGMRIYKMAEYIDPDPAIRYLEVCVYSQDGSYKADAVIENGSNKKLLEKLRSDNIVQIVNDKMADLLDFIRDTESDIGY